MSWSPGFFQPCGSLRVAWALLTLAGPGVWGLGLPFLRQLLQLLQEVAGEGGTAEGFGQGERIV